MSHDEAIETAERIRRLWLTINQEQMDATIEILALSSADYERVEDALPKVFAFDSKFFQLSKLVEFAGIKLGDAASRVSSWIDTQRAERMTSRIHDAKSLAAEKTKIERAVASISAEEWRQIADEIGATSPIVRRQLSAGKNPRDIQLVRFAAYDRRSKR